MEAEPGAQPEDLAWVERLCNIAEHWNEAGSDRDHGVIAVEGAYWPCTPEFVGHLVLNNVGDAYYPFRQGGIDLHVYTSPPGVAFEPEQRRCRSRLVRPFCVFDGRF